MSDLEARVTAGLAGVGEQAPRPADLASGARSRVRRRRRTTTAVVAGALVVVAIPVAVTLVGDGFGGTDGDGTSVATAPSDWRTETWRDLSVRVPTDWDWGGGADWCTSGRDVSATPPEVSRPGGVIPAIACSPSYGFGAHFLEPSGGELPPGTEGTVQQYRGDRYPDGAWIGYAATGQAAVWVVAEDRTTARLVLDSTEPVGEVDANGCATRLEMSAPSGSDRISVCRYDADGWLEQSEQLSPADSARAAAVLASAPGTGRGGCEPGPGGAAPAIVLQGAGVSERVALEGPCRGVVGADGTGLRDLTPDVLYWALSPGWSGPLSFLSYDKHPEPLELRRP